MSGRRQCGAAVTRCLGCDNTVSKTLDTCPRCRTSDFEPSTCRRSPLGKADRCELHGGRLPQVLAKQAVSELEGEAARILVANGHKPIQNPLTELMEVLGEQKALKEQLGQAVTELQSLTTFDLLGKENLRATFDAYTRVVDRYASMLVAAAKLNVEERLVAIHVAADRMSAQEFVDVVVPVLGLAPAELHAVMRRAVGDRLQAQEKGLPFPPLPDVPKFVRADVPPPPLALPAPAPAPYHHQVPSETPEPPPVPSISAEVVRVVRAYPPAREAW